MHAGVFLLLTLKVSQPSWRLYNTENHSFWIELNRKCSVFMKCVRIELNKNGTTTAAAMNISWEASFHFRKKVSPPTNWLLSSNRKINFSRTSIIADDLWKEDKVYVGQSLRIERVYYKSTLFDFSQYFFKKTILVNLSSVLFSNYQNHVKCKRKVGEWNEIHHLRKLTLMLMDVLPS